MCGCDNSSTESDFAARGGNAPGQTNVLGGTLDFDLDGERGGRHFLERVSDMCRTMSEVSKRGLYLYWVNSVLAWDRTSIRVVFHGYPEVERRFRERWSREFGDDLREAAEAVERFKERQRRVREERSAKAAAGDSRGR